jgi:glyoxylase-like metal-dependent hydrolase (beta-lactamase superfamily II)
MESSAMSANAIASDKSAQADAKAKDAEAHNQAQMRPEVGGGKGHARQAGTMVTRPEVQGFFDDRTYSVQYVVSDPATHRCAIIDPVLDFDEKSGATATRSADAILDYIRRRDLTVDWILDTHPHADHFSAAGYLKDVTGAPTAIGERVVDVQRLWKALYNFPDSFPTDGSPWDHLFADGEAFQVGELQGSVLFSPGHTLASITYVIGGAAFVHDTLFMPDSGTARADFPGGNAHRLWQSIQRILALPDDTPPFYRTRLPARRPTPRVGKHRGSAKGGKCPREWPPRGKFREAPYRPRPHLANAEADFVRPADQHRRGAASATGR